MNRTQADLAAAPQHVGRLERFFVALVDHLQRPQHRLSGIFESRDEAVGALGWLRARYPRARLVRETTYLTLED